MEKSLYISLYFRDKASDRCLNKNLIFKKQKFVLAVGMCVHRLVIYIIY